MTDTTDKSREDFEAWFRDHTNMGTAGNTLRRDITGKNYHFRTAQREWDIWQAARALPPAQAGVQLAPTRVNRLYLAGPMTGYAEFNFPAFNAAAAALRAEGLEVINPADHGIVEGAEWADYLRFDIAKIAGCESIALLPGWEKSKGARLEVHIAQALGMSIRLLDGASAPQPPASVEPAATRLQDLETFCESLVAPTPQMLEAFQAAFVRQLKRRKWAKKNSDDSAEVAGIKALIAVAAKPILAAAPSAPVVEPVLYVSPGQLLAHTDPDEDGEDGKYGGRYLPARVTRKGLFSQPLYALPPSHIATMRRAAETLQRVLDGAGGEFVPGVRVALADLRKTLGEQG